MEEWHDNDSFWELMAPMMFDQGHWAAAPDEIDQAIELLELLRVVKVRTHWI